MRELLVRRLSEKRYLMLYKLIMLAAFAWLIAAYRRAPAYILWTAPAKVKLAMLPVVFAGFLLIVPGLTTPNPTVVGAEKLFDRQDIVRGVLRVTRNPFLWGIGLFALAHIGSTGDLPSVLTFGSVGALGLIGAPLLDAKKAARHGTQWKAFAAATSSLPFLAIIQGRQRLPLAELGWWRMALALVLFLVACMGIDGHSACHQYRACDFDCAGSFVRRRSEDTRGSRTSPPWAFALQCSFALRRQVSTVSDSVDPELTEARSVNSSYNFDHST